jgi:hypothetical protein
MIISTYQAEIVMIIRVSPNAGGRRPTAMLTAAQINSFWTW